MGGGRRGERMGGEKRGVHMTGGVKRGANREEGIEIIEGRERGGGDSEHVSPWLLGP